MIANRERPIRFPYVIVNFNQWKTGFKTGFSLKFSQAFKYPRLKFIHNKHS